MWHTSCGKRCLQGVEKELFLRGLWFFVEQYTDGYLKLSDAISQVSECEQKNGDWFKKYAKSTFGYLEPKHKIVVMAEVVKCLLSKKSPPGLYAWNEAAVWIIFEGLRHAVDIEYDSYFDEEENKDCPYRFFYRGIVAKAYNEIIDTSCDGEFESEVCNLLEDDCTEWHNRIERLSDLILWDDDFLWPDQVGIMDMPPEQSTFIKDSAGISSDYFVQAPPDLTEENFRKSLKYLIKTTKDQ